MILLEACSTFSSCLKLHSRGAFSIYEQTLILTLTLTVNSVIVIYSNTFRLLIYRESSTPGASCSKLD